MDFSSSAPNMMPFLPAKRLFAITFFVLFDFWRVKFRKKNGFLKSDFRTGAELFFLSGLAESALNALNALCNNTPDL